MATKTWVKTSVSNLYSHSKSGIYYARIYRDGKNTFRSLRTKTFTVAKAKLHKMMTKLPSMRQTGATDPTIADLVEIRRAEINNSAALKKRSKDYTEILMQARILRGVPGRNPEDLPDGRQGASTVGFRSPVECIDERPDSGQG